MREILPIDSFIEEIVSGVVNNSAVILRASPGAGKTTRVAPALASKLPGKILMVEPRRVAAAGAARRIAFENNEKCGEGTGFIVRGEKCCGKNTQIICVTTGIFLNMIINDPELSQVSAVIFDAPVTTVEIASKSLTFSVSSVTEIRSHFRLST